MNKPLVAAPASEQPREAPHQRDSAGQFLFLVCRLRIGDGGHHLWSQASGRSPPKAARSGSSSTRDASAGTVDLAAAACPSNAAAGAGARTPSQIPWRGWLRPWRRSKRRGRGRERSTWCQLGCGYLSWLQVTSGFQVPQFRSRRDATLDRVAPPRAGGTRVIGTTASWAPARLGTRRRRRSQKSG
jgi:hypothetical protein